MKLADTNSEFIRYAPYGLGGRTILSRSGVRNRAGYAGYEFEPALPNSACLQPLRVAQFR